MKKYLALDFGTKRIGVAYSVLRHSEPLEIIPNDSQAIKNILKVCLEYEIDQIVFGISEQAMADQTQAFARQLKKQTDLPIHFFDETLSSKEVIRKLQESGAKQKTRQSPIDHFAAAHILDQYLDMQQA